MYYLKLNSLERTKSCNCSDKVSDDWHKAILLSRHTPWIILESILLMSSFAGITCAATLDDFLTSSLNPPAQDKRASKFSLSAANLADPITSKILAETVALPKSIHVAEIALVSFFEKLPIQANELANNETENVRTSQETIPSPFAPQTSTSKESLPSSKDSEIPSEVGFVAESDTQENQDGVAVAQATVPRVRIPAEPEPEVEPLPELPSLEDLFGPEYTPPTEEPDLPVDVETFEVSQFRILDSTVFSEEDLTVL